MIFPIATDYQIEVDNNSDFSSTIWDSTKTSLASSTPEGTRIADIEYGGSALASSTTYYWRIKFWDDSNAEGDWSTVTATFSLSAGNTAEVIQDLSFTYDKVGNIMAITEGITKNEKTSSTPAIATLEVMTNPNEA